MKTFYENFVLFLTSLFSSGEDVEGIIGSADGPTAIIVASPEDGGIDFLILLVILAVIVTAVVLLVRHFRKRKKK